ncbi:hypothetical protein U0070_000816 [Myodes glareolus]|uniref:Doublecortin domain-containing protein n=1 Tax=Myodes glareolus TaxID=447135 RepID=A0AAW0HR90_MYOGA
MFYAAIFQILSHLLSCVHRLYTMDGHLLDNSKDLQDNSFYVAAGLETFKYIPYWKSPRVPSEVQQRFGGNDKYPQTKKKVEPKDKEPLKNDSIPPKSQDSVYYAKEKKETAPGPLVQSGAEGDVYKAQTLDKETQEALEALEVREDPEVKVEVPVDQVGHKGWDCFDSAVSAPTFPIPLFSNLTPRFSLASRRFC